MGRLVPRDLDLFLWHLSNASSAFSHNNSWLDYWLASLGNSRALWLAILPTILSCLQANAPTHITCPVLAFVYTNPHLFLWCYSLDLHDRASSSLVSILFWILCSGNRRWWELPRGQHALASLEGSWPFGQFCKAILMLQVPIQRSPPPGGLPWCLGMDKDIFTFPSLLVPSLTYATEMIRSPMQKPSLLPTFTCEPQHLYGRVL